MAGLKNVFSQTNMNYLKTFENCYVRKIKITPVLNFDTDLKLVFFKNNIPISVFTADGGNTYIDYA